MSRTRRTPRSRPASRPAAARRPRTVQPKNADSVGGSRLTGRAAVLFLVMLVLVISYASSLRAWLQQRDELAAARADIAVTEDTIAYLEREERRYEDPAYIEQQARERFGWVLPGEVGYNVIGEDGEAIDSRTDLAEGPRRDADAEPEWYGRLWTSVKVAGRDPGEAAEADTERAPQGVIKGDRKSKRDRQGTQ